MIRLVFAVLASVLTLLTWADDAAMLQKAKAIHKRIIAFDSHLDLPFNYSGAAEDGKTQFNLPKVARGQLKGSALAVFVPQGPRTPEKTGRLGKTRKKCSR
jgi:membrane dipeptidase